MCSSAFSKLERLLLGKLIISNRYHNTGQKLLYLYEKKSVM